MEFGHENVAQYLLAHDPDIHLNDEEGWSILNLCIHHMVTIFSDIMDRGPNLNSCTRVSSFNPSLDMVC